MDYNWLLEAGKIAGAIGTIVTVSVMVIKFVIIKPMKAFVTDTIAEYTKPIQKNSNGGMSLPDANKKLIAISKKVDEIEERSEKRLDNIEHTLNLIVESITSPPKKK